jgi:head-tail adaptor
MRAGKFDKRLTVQRRTQVRDPGSGELVEVWARLGDVWAEMVDDRAIERYAAAQKIAEISTAWRMRWSPALVTLTPDEHRIVYGALTYDVKGCIEIQRRQGVIAFCVARTEGSTAQGRAPEA